MKYATLLLLALLTACAAHHRQITWHATRSGWVYGTYIVHRTTTPCGQPATYEWWYVTEEFDGTTGGWSCIDVDRNPDVLKRRVEQRMKP